MAAVDLLTRDDFVTLLRELVEIRAELARLREDREAEAVTPAEAARRLGLSLRTVQRMVKAGELASVKVGGARRVRLAGVLPPPAPSE